MKRSGKTQAECKAAEDAAANSTTASKGDALPSATAPFAFPEEQSRNGGELEQRTPNTAPAGTAGLPEMPTTPVPDPPPSSLGRGSLPGSSSSSRGEDVSSSKDAVDPDADIAPTVADPHGPVKASSLEDLGSLGETTKVRARLEETRVADDLKVGRYYLKDGNPQGAYMRFKDAVDRAPDDAEAHFGLAESALKLGKRDEASLHFKETLRLDPDGDNDKASRKALATLAVKKQ